MKIYGGKRTGNHHSRNIQPFLVNNTTEPPFWYYFPNSYPPQIILKMPTCTETHMHQQQPFGFKRRKAESPGVKKETPWSLTYHHHLPSSQAIESSFCIWVHAFWTQKRDLGTFILHPKIGIWECGRMKYHFIPNIFDAILTFPSDISLFMQQNANNFCVLIYILLLCWVRDVLVVLCGYFRENIVLNI